MLGINTKERNKQNKKAPLHIKPIVRLKTKAPTNPSNDRGIIKFVVYRQKPRGNCYYYVWR